MQENSYEKVRMTYRLQDVQILIDIYPFGAFVKLIGDEKNVKPTAAQLHLSQEKSVRGHADSAYLEWCQRMYLPEQWEVIFGLGGAVHSGRS